METTEVKAYGTISATQLLEEMTIDRRVVQAHYGKLITIYKRMMVVKLIFELHYVEIKMSEFIQKDNFKL